MRRGRRLRPGIADPQGATIERSLPALGFDGVTGVRVGKAIRFAVDAADEAAARAEVDDLCDALPHQPGDRGRRTSSRQVERRLMAPRVGVVLFPGSNCEHDVVEAVGPLGGDGRARVARRPRRWATSTPWSLPGGFAHGDYLRPGAIARFSPVMDAVAEFAAAGGPVVGICNGFQVLTEAGLLPGALQKNAGPEVPLPRRSSCGWRATDIGAHRRRRGRRRSCGSRSTTSRATTPATPRRSAELRAEDRIVLRYVDNPNGSVDDIAGICNAGRNVVGLMPHPERACDALLGSADGAVLLRSLLTLVATAGASTGRAELPLVAQLPRRDAGLLEHGRRSTPTLAPGGVGDALAVAVGLGRLRRTPFSSAPRSTALSACGSSSACEVHALLDELQPR